MFTLISCQIEDKCYEQCSFFRAVVTGLQWSVGSYVGTAHQADTPMNCVSSYYRVAGWFVDWPRYLFICPWFIVSCAKWLSPCLRFTTAVLQISNHLADEFPVKGQMVEGPQHQRKLCLSTAIVVACSHAVHIAQQQRAVVMFHLLMNPEVLR